MNTICDANTPGLVYNQERLKARASVCLLPKDLQRLCRPRRYRGKLTEIVLYKIQVNLNDNISNSSYIDDSFLTVVTSI